MNTIDLLLQHRSIRKYKAQSIEKEKLNRILEAGVRGSNTGNMQIYSIVVTQDAERKKELAKHHFGQKMVVDAGAVVTVCVDINRYHKLEMPALPTTIFCGLLLVWLMLLL